MLTSRHLSGPFNCGLRIILTCLSLFFLPSCSQDSKPRIVIEKGESDEIWIPETAGTIWVYVTPMDPETAHLKYTCVKTHEAMPITKKSSASYLVPNATHRSILVALAMHPPIVEQYPISKHLQYMDKDIKDYGIDGIASGKASATAAILSISPQEIDLSPYTKTGNVSVEVSRIFGFRDRGLLRASPQWHEITNALYYSDGIVQSNTSTSYYRSGIGPILTIYEYGTENNSSPPREVDNELIIGTKSIERHLS